MSWAAFTAFLRRWLPLRGDVSTPLRTANSQLVHRRRVRAGSPPPLTQPTAPDPLRLRRARYHRLMVPLKPSYDGRKHEQQA